MGPGLVEPGAVGADAAGDGLTVVVIGLNAKSTIEASLLSVRRACEPIGGARVIYVDGGSRDNSVAIARRLGVEVIQLATDRPTAAKGRNAGWRAATTPLVQFVDSDTKLEPDWLVHAVGAIREDGRVAGLFGQLIESNPTASIYNRVCGFDWHIPPGDWRMCGGNVLFRLEALREAGGFDEDLGAGEEADLCWRLRRRRWRIVCIDAVMAHHDLGMAGFRPYWKRAVRSGYAYAEIGLRFARTEDPLWFREFLKNLVMLPAGPAAAIAAAILGGPTGVLILAMLLATGFLWKILALKGRIPAPHLRALYVLHLGFVKVPLFVGTVQHLFRRWIRRRP